MPRRRKAAREWSLIFRRDELYELRAVCAGMRTRRAVRFIKRCALIRLHYESNTDALTLTPGQEGEKFRRWRRMYEPGARGPRMPPAPLTALDAARLALVAPAAQPHGKRDATTAAAFGKLEKAPRPTRFNDRAKHAAVYELRALFDAYGLTFTDYDSTESTGGKRGAAARVLRVILGDRAPGNLRNLIRATLKTPR